MGTATGPRGHAHGGHAAGRALWGYPAGPGHGAEWAHAERGCAAGRLLALGPQKASGPKPAHCSPPPTSAILWKHPRSLPQSSLSGPLGWGGTSSPRALEALETNSWLLAGGAAAGVSSPLGDVYQWGRGRVDPREQPARRVGAQLRPQSSGALAEQRPGPTATICWKRSCACPARPPGPGLPGPVTGDFPCLSGRPAGRRGSGGCSLCVARGPSPHGSARWPWPSG